MHRRQRRTRQACDVTESQRRLLGAECVQHLQCPADDRPGGTGGVPSAHVAHLSLNAEVLVTIAPAPPTTATASAATD
jgi:hypothetical protein